MCFFGGLGKLPQHLDAEVPLNMQRLKLALRSNRVIFFGGGKGGGDPRISGRILGHGFIDICDAKEKKFG